VFDPSLMIAPDVGGKVAQGFKEGMAVAAQNKARAAMAALVRDPNNQKALEALASIDPGAAQQFQQQRIETTRAQLAQHQDSILKGAQILRQFNPKDQPSYSAALTAAQQAGIDVSQVPQQYNPQYVDGIVKLADALRPQPETQDPGIIREFDIATQRGLVPPGTTYEQYVTMRNPGMSTPVTVPYGATVTPPGGASAPITATGPKGEKIQFNPQSGKWEPMGGAGGNASGGFPQ